MGYHIVFRTLRGNTSVEVEDLARSGVSCSHCTKGEYPGVCEHCGKLHIRYLAKVKQDVADTLVRASDKAGDGDKRLVRSDEEIAALGIALMDGKTFKEMNVGCVCVSKYLEDCGVDAGLASRLQFEVNRVTGYLQQNAALDAAKAEDRLTESCRRAEIVSVLRERFQAIRAVQWNNPNVKTDEDRKALVQVRSDAFDVYEKAAKRWQRENHGWNLSYKPTPTPATLVAFFDEKIKHNDMKLRKYMAGASFVA